MGKVILGYNVVSFLRAPPSATATIVISAAAAGGAIRFGETAATTTIRALTITMKAVGGVFVGIGILADVYSLGKSIKELVNDEKCPVSESISEQLESLKKLQNDIASCLASM